MNDMELKIGTIQESTSTPQSEQCDSERLNGGIDPENEIKGVRLLLLHIAISLCTFLVGLVI